MPTTRIKICGITTPDDALAVVHSGADAIGLVFYAKSPRAVSIEQAQRITDVVPPFVSVVALVVDEPVAGIERILSSVPVDMIQFHGDESAQFCQQFQRPWIKALRVKFDTDVVAATESFSAARGVLLDSFQPGIPGGTGTRFDWKQAPRDLPMPWILAGGLLPENVAEAVATLHPCAVDVSGGVESSPGVKDIAKIEQFVAAVRSADQQALDE